MLTKTFVKAGGIIFNDGELLICKRRNNKDYVLPKGHCDQNESLEECAIREVKEETGRLCKITEFIGTHSYEKIVDDQIIISVVYVYEMEKISYSSQYIITDEIEDILRIPLTSVGIQKLTHQNDRDFVMNYCI